MKKCIISFLICFVFAFGVITAFGCRDEVYASDSLSPIIGGVDMTISSSGVDYPYIFTVQFNGLESSDFVYQCGYVKSSPSLSSSSEYANSGYLFLMSAQPFTLESYRIFEQNLDADEISFDISDSASVVSGDGFYYLSINFDARSCSNDFTYNFPYSLVSYSSYTDAYNDNNIEQIATDIWNRVIKLEHGFTVEFEYSDEIGYLTGFSHQATQYIESESSNSDQGKFWDTYSWNLSTSTGYSIQPDDTVKLRLVCSYGDFARDIVEYDVSGDKSVYMVDRSDLLEQCDSIAAYKDSLSFWEILTSGFGKSDPLSVVCYACVFTSDGRCGSWIRQDSTWNMDNGGNGYDSNVSVGNFDDDGNFVSDSDKGYVGGQGNSTYDPDTGILYSGVDNLDSSSLIGAIKNLVDGVGQVPQIIALMFLWLPSWVLTFFSVCVAIWGLVLVKKAIFG